VKAVNWRKRPAITTLILFTGDFAEIDHPVSLESDHLISV
jgi:hypothetical protein